MNRIKLKTQEFDGELAANMFKIVALYAGAKGIECLSSCYSVRVKPLTLDFLIATAEDRVWRTALEHARVDKLLFGGALVEDEGVGFREVQFCIGDVVVVEVVFG